MMILQGQFATTALDIIAASQTTETIAVGDVITGYGHRGPVPSTHPLAWQAREYVYHGYPRPYTLSDTTYRHLDRPVLDGHVGITAVRLVRVWHDPDGAVRFTSALQGSEEDVMKRYFDSGAEAEARCRTELSTRRYWTPTTTL